MKQLIFIAIVLALIVAGYFAYQGVVSRNQKAPGLIDGRLSPCDVKPNSVCSQKGTDQDHFIKPIGLCVTNMSSVVADVESLGGRVVVLEEDYLAAEFSSSLFGFVDDLELLRDPVAGVIHMRSASRVGYSDMGVNRKRAEALRKRLESEQ
ncbi:DUF1499 domain-containing protein [uncultured Amphritea sp.]|uniref:DUF1499 domain-containing protein n=1 Tax=uncultured Amphritea sp. TaxID=981605 RepID=UPI002628149E|nr:DUF1499 domain-containing protein [uncultured Amphritea sp.]